MCKRNFLARILFSILMIATLLTSLFGLFSALASPAFATAGINKEINFQGKVVNKTTGTNIADGSYTFVFSIYNVSSGGSATWTETKSITIANGVFQTLLGDTN